MKLNRDSTELLKPIRANSLGLDSSSAPNSSKPSMVRVQANKPSTQLQIQRSYSSGITNSEPCSPVNSSAFPNGLKSVSTIHAYQSQEPEPMEGDLSCGNTINTPEVETLVSRMVKTNSRYGSSEPSSKRTSPTNEDKSIDCTIPTHIDSMQKNQKNTGLGKVVPPSQDWIHCFCEVRFDLETGQAIDRVYPGYDLSKDELKNIAFAAFPDTRVFDQGDMVYQFRVRKGNTGASTKYKDQGQGRYDTRLIAKDQEFYTGYVYFRQRKDSRVHRGYYQKSIVLLTSLPLPATVGLFTHLITMVGSQYHDYDCGVEDSISQVFLEAAVQDLSRWPRPSYGTMLEVPFAGTVLQIEMPDNHHPTLQLLETSRLSPTLSPSEVHLLASVPDGSSPGLLLHWWDRLTDLWTLWELMLLGEPLVVMAPDPATCSHVVTELLDLIKPIPYCGDFRPYLTIQDPDFKALVTKKRVPTHTILGVTNPYFNEVLNHWPHWIQVGTASTPAATTVPKSVASNTKHTPSPFSLPKFPFKNNITNTGSFKLGSSRTAAPRPKGVYTTRKSCIAKDKNLIHQLTASMLRGDRSATVLNNRLRRYFGELTERFLAPLNRYVATLMPTNVSGLHLTAPNLKPFRHDEFLLSLTSHGVPTSTPHTSWGIDLYKQFLNSGNFATWLHTRTLRSEHELRRLYLEQLCDVDIGTWSKNHPEVELVDLVLKMLEVINTLPEQEPSINEERKILGATRLNRTHASALSDPPMPTQLANKPMHRHNSSCPPQPTTLEQKNRQRLDKQIQEALGLLPKDMREILVKNR